MGEALLAEEPLPVSDAPPPEEVLPDVLSPEEVLSDDVLPEEAPKAPPTEEVLPDVLPAAPLPEKLSSALLSVALRPLVYTRSGYLNLNSV